MIQKRTHTKYAPQPIEEKPESKTYKYKVVRKAVWKPSKYTEMLYMSMFRKWQS